VLDQVKPERDQLGGNSSAEGRKRKWWLFGRDAKSLYHAVGRGAPFAQHPAGWDRNVKPLTEVLVSARVGKYFLPSVVPNVAVFHNKCIVFAAAQANALAALFNSSPVQAWVWHYSGRMKLDLSLSPTDAIETFPFLSGEVLALFEKQGREYLQGRREVMTAVENPIGLTKLYNRFHDAEDVDPRIAQLREMHRELDAAVLRAYGWNDLDLGHGYFEQPNLAENDRVRFTISDASRAEVLRRFAELNRQRYEEEQASGEPARPRRTKADAKTAPTAQGALALLDSPTSKTTNSKTKSAAPATKTSTRSTRR